MVRAILSQEIAPFFEELGTLGDIERGLSIVLPQWLGGFSIRTTMHPERQRVHGGAGQRRALAADRNDDFTGRATGLNGLVGLVHPRQGEMPGIDARSDLALYRQTCRLAQDLAVMRAAFAGQQRQQSEDAGIGPCTKREGCQRMRPPTKCADDMSKPADSLEGKIEGLPACGIIDDIEASAAGVPVNVTFDRNLPVIDRKLR